MKRRFVLAFFLTAAVGTAMHFAYDWLPIPLVGLFAPVNESVWEHLKLLFWPYLAAAFLLTRSQAEKHRAWCGFLLAQLAMPLFLLGVYYLLLGGFSVSSLALDVGLYYVSLALGFWLAWRLQGSEKGAAWSGILVILAGLYGAALVLFTMAPPDLPIFLENL